MAEYTIRRPDPLMDNQHRPIVQMSVGAYERLHGRLIKLSAIETAARAIFDAWDQMRPTTGNPRADSYEPQPVADGISLSLMLDLKHALRAYDGWEDDEETYECAVRDMQAIVRDLEERDADL